MADEDDFGGPPDAGGGTAPPPSGNAMGAIIPFGRIKADPVIAESWIRERTAHNQKSQTAYTLKSPLDALAEMERKRSLPVLPLPPAWSDFAKRARLYAGEVMGISGPTGGGKTSFAVEIACAAIGQGIPVLWLPKELDEPELNLRIVANRTHTHTRVIREEWTGHAIERVLIATVVDRWHYIDDFRDNEKQLEAVEAAIVICKRVYGRAPLLVVDYLGKFARGAREIRTELADVTETLRLITMRHDAFSLLLSQTSRGNDAKLSGKVDLDSAADAIGVAAETSELEHAASVCVALNVFKADDADILDAHVLVSKARGSGKEGRTGFNFVKAGGQWRELDYIPATPTEVTAEQARQKKDKTRVHPAGETREVRKDLNVERADKSSRARSGIIIAALKRAGIEGMGTRDIRKLRGCGNWKRLQNTLNDLANRKEIEERGVGKWRIASQMSL